MKLYTSLSVLWLAANAIGVTSSISAGPSCIDNSEHQWLFAWVFIAILVLSIFLGYMMRGERK